MTLKKTAVLFLSLVILAGLAFASAQDDALQRRQKVRGDLVTLKLLRLTQALDLTEEQAAKIYPSINRIEKEKMDIQKRMSADIRDLRSMVNGPTPKESDIEIKYKNVRAAQQSIKDKDAELDEFLEKNLNVDPKSQIPTVPDRILPGFERQHGPGANDAQQTPSQKII